MACLAEEDQSESREELGLTPISENMTETRFGLAVSDSDAERLDRMTEIRDGLEFGRLREAYVDRYGDRLISVTWSYVDGVEVRLLPGSDESAVGDVARKFGIEDSVIARSVPGAVSELERRKLRETMRSPEALELFDSAGVFSVEGSERCGTITLLVKPGGDVDAARNQVSSLVPLEKVIIREADKFEVDQDAVGRVDHLTIQSGGLRYVSGGGGCTSAVPFYQNVGGTQVFFAVTAGHCVPQGQWSSTPPNWGGIWWTVATTNTNLRQPTNSDTVATAQGRIRYGAELDVAVWEFVPAHQFAAPRTAQNSDAHNYNWHNLGGPPG